MNIREISGFLAKIDPFSTLPPAALSTLAESSVPRSAEAKELIFLEGDEGEAAYVVVDGRVAMIKSSANGKELIVELLPPGELFGIVAIQDKPYPLSARAQIPSLIVALPRRALLQVVSEHPELQRGFFEIIASRLQASHNLARAIAHDRVETRVASVLLALIPRFSLAPSAHTSVTIGRQELADLCGITIETASRVTKSLERDGVLDLGTLGIVGIRERDTLVALAESSI